MQHRMGSRRRPQTVAVMFAWWFGAIVRIGGTFALIVAVGAWLRGLDARFLVALVVLCGLTAWGVGLGYDAIVSRLPCSDAQCSCRTASGSRLVRAMECASAPELPDVAPWTHYPYWRPPWTFRALRWFEVLCVAGFVLMVIHAVLTGPGHAPPR